MDYGAKCYDRFLAGDDNGLVEIIRDYKDGLMLYMNGFSKDIYIAEELTEETFVKLVVKRPKYHGKSSFKTWLYAIGRNVAMDYFRHHPSMTSLSGQNAQAVIEMTAAEKSLEAAYIMDEQKLALHHALKKLKTEYRQALYLSYFEGFQNGQIATIMKKNKRQVENLLYRGKQSLKTELEKEGFIYEEL